jgi:hypothetical protein
VEDKETQNTKKKGRRRRRRRRKYKEVKIHKVQYAMIFGLNIMTFICKNFFNSLT